jgi:hypothetical protein
MEYSILQLPFSCCRSRTAVHPQSLTKCLYWGDLLKFVFDSGVNKGLNRISYERCCARRWNWEPPKST